MPAATVAPFAPLATPGVNTLADSTVMDALLAALRAAINSHAADIDAVVGGPDPVSLPLIPQDFGAIADGASHPLSTVYLSLAAAQAVYPFATALTQEIDYCACKAMSNAALGADGAENADVNAHLNKRMYLPAGRYVFGNDTWLIRNASGISITGAAKRATKLLGNNVVLGFDGLWYSEVKDIAILKQAVNALPALDIDGNVPGHPYATRGVQGCKFVNVFVDGIMGEFTVAMTRLGGSSGQGSECVFDNCHFSSANQAVYYQNGYNALNNTFIGGNMQGYNKHGIYLVAGQVSVISMGFQSTSEYTQIANNGYDIDCASGGVLDKILVIGCRSESLRFYHGAGSQEPFIAACNGNPSGLNWTALSPVTLNRMVYKTVSGRVRWYRATTAGTTGAAEPTWPTTGTVADGSVVWIVTTVDWINIHHGTVDRGSVNATVGRILIEQLGGHVEVNADYTIKPGDCDILVDSTAGPITISVPANNDVEFPSGTVLTITRHGADANLVSVQQSDGGYINYVVNSANLAGGARGSVTLKHLGGGIVGRRWMILSKVSVS